MSSALADIVVAKDTTRIALSVISGLVLSGGVYWSLRRRNTQRSLLRARVEEVADAAGGKRTATLRLVAGPRDGELVELAPTRLAVEAGDELQVHPCLEHPAALRLTGTPRTVMPGALIGYGVLLLAAAWLAPLQAQLVFPLFSGLLVVAGIGVLVGALRFARASRKVGGMIVAQRSRSGDTTYEPQVEYEIDGRVRRSWTGARRQSSFGVGKRVCVYVDPRAPAVGTLYTVWTWIFPITLLILGLIGLTTRW
ncbi:DUF3592 domain-containing protein [Allokutzneria sp. A3M-2-11 16]|uniref:DUF3592 domain-containing protein n=1 Tax=Allokutzneria sp. A3M-2-11 16 TaxID=2962043 RepID=UPI0020B69F79|nr:DUF3592 domain-containing protein [Allokutzneria sp. A3M-2-11 16]MCP3799815.1 DUF3592 domain-containing protein [Allokutzneria sp. A3M-2-11 16]